MRNKRRKYIKMLVLTIICLFLAGVLVVGALFFIRLRRDYDQVVTEKEKYLAESAQKQQEIEALQEQIAETDTKEAEQEAAKDEQAKQNAEAQNAEAQDAAQQGPAAQDGTAQAQGTVSQPEGSSAFSSEGLTPGEILNLDVAAVDLNSYFQSAMIERDGAIFNRINGKSYQDNPDVALEDLRYLTMIHYNFDHQIQVGEMIVNAAIAEDVLQVFKELFQNEYEVQSMYLIDKYWQEGMTGDELDYASIDVNNTSAFNYRPVTGGTNLSNHAYGRAIDINPQQNPYVTGSGEYSHANAAPYIDRSSGDPHVIVAGDICYNIFTNYGFGWGGAWASPIDYQHFEKTVS